MAPKQQKRAIAYWLAGIVLWGLSGAYFLHRYPLTLPAPTESEKPAEFLLRDTNAPLAVIVDTSNIHRSWKHRSLDSCDFSYGWANVFEYGVGPFDILNAGDIDSSSLAERKLVAITVSALYSIPANTITSYISNGGAAILDDPDSVTFSKLGIPGESGHSRAPDEFRVTTLGKGTLVISGADFGKALTMTMQGAPDNDMIVRNRHVVTGNNYLEANDLALDSSYFGSNINFPSANAACAKLFTAMATQLPVPRWHTAPDTFSGIFLMTHDEEGIGDHGVWMNKYENSVGASSTTFILPAETHSSNGLEFLRELGGEIGLHWNRFDRLDKGAYDTLRIWKWGPLKQKRSLENQLHWLENLTGESAPYNRNHYFLWDKHYSRTFRILNAQSITMDFSYGPDLDQKGYLYGTAFPFHPLDENGAAFEMYETPVTWAENFAGADSQWVDSVLRANTSEYHGVIAPLYHNNTYDWRPDYNIYQHWRNVYQLAQKYGHAFYRVSELESFITARRESPLIFELAGGQLNVSGEALDGRLAALIPAKGVGKPQTNYPVEKISIFGEPHWRVNVPPGKFSFVCDRLETNIKQR